MRSSRPHRQSSSHFLYLSILLALRSHSDELAGVLLSLVAYQWEVGGLFFLFILCFCVAEPALGCVGWVGDGALCLAGCFISGECRLGTSVSFAPFFPTWYRRCESDSWTISCRRGFLISDFRSVRLLPSLWRLFFFLNGGTPSMPIFGASCGPPPSRWQRLR